MNLKKLSRAILDWVAPSLPGPVPATLGTALAMTQRERFSSLLSYRHFDEDYGIAVLDDATHPAAGFVLAFSPLLVAGKDAEAQFEAIINSCPPNTTLQFGKISSNQVADFVDGWAYSRLKGTDDPVLRQMALRRREFMLATAAGPSLLPEGSLHPRTIQYYLSVRVPYTGELTSREQMDTWLTQVRDLRNSMQGILKGMGIQSEPLTETQLKFLLRELLNPHLSSQERVKRTSDKTPYYLDLVDGETRIAMGEGGSIGFSREAGNSPPVVVVPITIDAPPQSLSLYEMAGVLGHPNSREDRITVPYWAYTNIHVLDFEDARDSLTAKFGVLNKQTMSESAWVRSMMGFLYERKGHVENLLSETRSGRKLVRAYSGLNIYAPPEQAKIQAEQAMGLWRKTGFRVSAERYISLPVFIASLPLQYTPRMDPPNGGLQRASLMSSLNASTLLHVQGDWVGTGPLRKERKDGSVEKYGAGPLLVSRKGQLASFDLLQTAINYNFVVVAASGSGKSYLTNEIAADFLSKGGMVRIIDVGRSYEKVCRNLNGEFIVFDPQRPPSLNPFTNIRTRADMDEMMPMIKDLIRLMAYPLTEEKDTPAFEYQLIEKAVNEAWIQQNDKAELRHVYEWLMSFNDSRAADLALQIEPYAIGRYSRWFSGPRTVDFNKAYAVVELEELKQDASLQAVVLQLVMHQVTKEMYLSDIRRPKLLIIDEAWDLMGGLKTGRFIETAFRRMRKYNGIAGVVTQSFQDFDKSQAARAALDNAAWQFILHQRPESLEYAKTNQSIVADEMSYDLLSTVKSGNGYSEVFVRGETGSGLYRFVADRHTHYLFTTQAMERGRLVSLVESGLPMEQAIDQLATEDYRKRWGMTPAEVCKQKGIQLYAAGSA